MFTFEYAMRGEICKVQTVRLFSLTKRQHIVCYYC